MRVRNIVLHTLAHPYIYFKTSKNMNEKIPSQDVKKTSTNQALRPLGDKLIKDIDLPPAESIQLIQVLSARLTAERLTTEEMAAVDAILTQLQAFGRGAQMAMLKVISGEMSERNLKAGRGLVPVMFKSLLEEHGAGALRVILSSAERTAKIMQRRDQAEQWRP